MKYRKKSVVIEAMEFTDKTKDQVYNFVRCNKAAGFNAETKPILIVQTLSGDVTVDIGDYVLKGVNGEFYPCKADIFKKTYEAVTD